MRVTIALCDRGTVDGVAYWPGPEDFWPTVGTSNDVELGRYHTVIHLRTPSAAFGYNHANQLRTETAMEAADIDRRIADAWSGHPNRIFVDSSPDFLGKAARVLDLIRAALPACCQGHELKTK